MTPKYSPGTTRITHHNDTEINRVADNNALCNTKMSPIKYLHLNIKMFYIIGAKVLSTRPFVSKRPSPLLGLSRALTSAVF